MAIESPYINNQPGDVFLISVFTTLRQALEVEPNFHHREEASLRFLHELDHLSIKRSPYIHDDLPYKVVPPQL